MAKMVTPQMERINRRNRSRSGKKRRSSPARDAWKRLCRNRTAIVGLVIVVILLLLIVFADVIAPYDYAKQDYNAMNQLPSAQHLFGTDNVGRDIFSRCIYGSRISLPIGLICVVTSLALGGTLGFVAAYFGGKADNIIMRVMDVFQSIPGALMSIAIIAALGNGMSRLILAISVSMMPACAKMCRAAIFTVRGNEYIESSKAIGASGLRQLNCHMIPNAVGPIIIFAVGMVSSNIMIVSTLSYLGLGITPPDPEWGALLSAGKEFINSSPHMVLFPGLMIMTTVFAFNLLGDGLRDALDPRLK